MENARVDLTFKKSGVKVKGDVNTLLLNSYLDLFDVDAMKVFVRAGIGLGKVKAKDTYVGGSSFCQKDKYIYICWLCRY